MSMSFTSSSDTNREQTEQEVEDLVTSIVHYRRPKLDQDLDKNNKQIQHLEKVRKLTKKKVAAANISTEAVSK